MEPPRTRSRCRRPGAASLDDFTIVRAKRGDPRAFRAIVQAYSAPVHALIGRITTRACTPSEVEELAQEAFLRVHRGLVEFEPRGPGPLRKWVLTIATRLAVDHLRKRRIIRLSLEEHDPRDPGVPPDEQVRRHDLAHAIADAMVTLSPTHRAVLVLREFHDLEYQEIAAALDLDLGTVKSRISRARAALRSVLEELRHA